MISSTTSLPSTASQVDRKLRISAMSQSSYMNCSSLDSQLINNNYHKQHKLFMSDNQLPLHLDVARSDSRISDMILFSSATHLEQTVSVLSAPESQSPALHPPVSTTTSMRRFSGANVNNV